MPAVLDKLTRDQELLLIVERDLPQMKEAMEELEEKQDDLATKIDECGDAISKLDGKVDILSSDIKSIMNSQSLPWWRDFTKILIVLFGLGYMALAGVKSAETVIASFNPINTESTTEVP